MITEAKLIVPLSAKEYLDTLEHHLTEFFGGFTFIVGYGSWKSPSGEVIGEAVYIYTIAADWSKDAWDIENGQYANSADLLRWCASPLLVDYGQQSVYLSFDGAVEFLTKPKEL